MSWIPGAIGIASSVIPMLSSLWGDDEDENPIRSQSTLSPEQRPLLSQAVNAGLRPGAGGAFGDAADYYRGNLSNNPRDFEAFANPELRKYNEEIVPGLSEQFAGMGAGGLSSSGFRNAQIQGATDLSERLAQLRANLRMQSAQGLTGIGQIGLGNYSENVRNQPQPSFWQSASQGLGQGIGNAGVNWAADQWNNRNNNTPAPPGPPQSPTPPGTPASP